MFSLGVTGCTEPDTGGESVTDDVVFSGDFTPLTEGATACWIEGAGWVACPDQPGTDTKAPSVPDGGGPLDPGTPGPGADIGQADAGPAPGEFGAPCNGNTECISGWCVEGPAGYVCTDTCIDDCPDGFSCKSVLSAGTDIFFVCVPTVKKVCTPCIEDFQCAEGACLEIGGESACSFSCQEDAECPEGYACDLDPGGVKDGTYCIPKGGTCSCTAE
ncbi:MAG: hypothetical protein ACI9WU_003681, partial [Myxococcota bacterium]